MPKKGEKSLSQAARTLGRKGGKVGGPARARVLTKAQRVEIARKGAAASNKAQGRGKG